MSNILDVFHTAVSCRARKCSKTRFVCFYKWRLDVSRSHFKNFESRTRKCFRLPKIKRFPPPSQSFAFSSIHLPFTECRMVYTFLFLTDDRANPNEINTKKTSNDASIWGAFYFSKKPNSRPCTSCSLAD